MRRTVGALSGRGAFPLRMNEFFAILSQLGWGLTVGALTAAVTALAQIAGVVLCAVAGGGCTWWWWRRRARLGRGRTGRDGGDRNP